MIKVGDMVEAFEEGVYHKVGERFVVESISIGCAIDNKGHGVHLSKVRHALKTEAEKRGAKFGVGGVVKSTGSKWVFACEIEGFWKGIVENGVVVTGEPHQFRLDHDPEYREIPFSEATHEQRMDVDNLVHAGGAIVKEIYCFQNGGYAYTTNWAKTPSTALFRLTVRIPA